MLSEIIDFYDDKKTYNRIEDILNIILDSFEGYQLSYYYKIKLDSGFIDKKNFINGIVNRIIDRVGASSSVSLILIIEIIINYTMEQVYPCIHPITHQKRVGSVVSGIAMLMGFEKKIIQNLTLAGNLHDIGKTEINLNVLNKKSNLNKDELVHMRSHVAKGRDIIRNLIYNFKEIKEDIDFIADGAFYHHENEDGSGYPLGIKDSDIPFHAKIIRVADTSVAMQEQRHYKEQMNIRDVINELKNNIGKKYNKKIVEIYLSIK